MTSKIFFKAIGIFFLGLALIGAALPILPTTPFLLISASCFAKSSPRLHAMLLNNKVFGALITDWQNHRTIAKKSKIIALVTMLLSVFWSCYILEDNYLKLLVIAIILGPFIFVACLPHSKTHSAVKD
ncbi:YbaN family protein [Colwelliaceae bacterium 6471]